MEHFSALVLSVTYFTLIPIILLARGFGLPLVPPFVSNKHDHGVKMSRDTRCAANGLLTGVQECVEQVYIDSVCSCC